MINSGSSEEKNILLYWLTCDVSKTVAIVSFVRFMMRKRLWVTAEHYDPEKKKSNNFKLKYQTYIQKCNECKNWAVYRTPMIKMKKKKKKEIIPFKYLDEKKNKTLI